MASDLLVLIYDLNPLPWSSPHSPYTVTTVTQQLLIYVNAFYLLNKSNKLAMILTSNHAVQYIYPSPSTAPAAAAPADAATELYDADHTPAAAAEAAANTNVDGNYMNVHHTLSKAIKQFVTRQHEQHTTTTHHTDTTSTLLSGALSLAMCYIHKQKLLNTKLRARIMCVLSSVDSSGQYVPVMNAVFEAQKLGVPIDALILQHSRHIETKQNGSDVKPINLTDDGSGGSEADSRLMQQASHITGGVYHKPLMSGSDDMALLQYLFTMYLPDGISRQQLILPQLSQVDYRASCFWHRDPVDLAFVCPVCLAIWCKQSAKCDVCNTRFSAATRQLPAAKT